MAAAFQDSNETMRQALERTIDAISGRTITLRELIDQIGEQGLLFICALLSIPFLIPVSIPGVSTVFGTAIILISIGITVNRPPWLPSRIMDRPLDAGKLVPTLRRGAGVVARVENWIRPRLRGFTDGPLVNRINGLGLIFGGVLLLFPLGLVPFSNTLPAFAILLLAVGMSQKDGAVVLAGYAMLLATVIYFGALAWAAFAAGQGLLSIVGS